MSFKLESCVGCRLQVVKLQGGRFMRPDLVKTGCFSQLKKVSPLFFTIHLSLEPYSTRPPFGTASFSQLK